MELISLIRLSKGLLNKSALSILLLPMGVSLSLTEGIPLYDGLFKEIAETRMEDYNSFIKELINIEAGMKVEQERTEGAKGRQLEALPQFVDQWRKENPTSLLSLRLKILTAQVGRKTTEAQELESRLTTAFQSLLSQWSTPPQTKETIPQPQKRITLTPPPPPSPLSPWWKSPSVIPLPPSAPELEKEIESKVENFTQQVNKGKLQIQEKIRGYERILKEVKRRCPLP